MLNLIAAKIEQAVYKFSKEYSTSNETPFLFEQIYMTKISELIEQLKKSKNLVKNILEKKLNQKNYHILQLNNYILKNIKKLLKKRNRRYKKIIDPQQMLLNVLDVKKKSIC